MDWLPYLMIFGSIQGLVLAIALLSVKKPKAARINRLFALLVVLISVFLLTSSQINFFVDYPKLFLLSYLFLFCYTPVFHLFLRLLKEPTLKLQRKDLIYLLPVTVYLGALTRYLFMPKPELVLAMQTGNYTDLASTDFLALMLNFYFLYDGWKGLKSRENTWTSDQLTPLRLFFAVMVFTNLMWVFLVIPRTGLSLGFIVGDFPAVWTLNAFLIFFFTYFVVVRSDLFMAPPTKVAAYKHVQKNQSDFSELETRVREVMQKEKPYLNPEFSLGDLSELCKVDKFRLSMTINQGMNTSFFNLINSYRVEEFTRLAQSEAHRNFSLLGIAQESGFKSKSTFYKAFKEFKGQSPKEYLDQAKSVA